MRRRKRRAWSVMRGNLRTSRGRPPAHYVKLARSLMGRARRIASSASPEPPRALQDNQFALLAQAALTPTALELPAALSVPLATRSPRPERRRALPVLPAAFRRLRVKASASLARKEGRARVGLRRPAPFVLLAIMP